MHGNLNFYTMLKLKIDDDDEIMIDFEAKLGNKSHTAYPSTF